MAWRATGGVVVCVLLVGCGQSSSNPGTGDGSEAGSGASAAQGGHSAGGATGGASAGATSFAGRFGDGGSPSGVAGNSGKAGAGGAAGHAGVGGIGGGGAAGNGGSAPVEEYPEPLPAKARYSEGGISADLASKSLAVTQPETSASSGLWLISSNLQFFRSSQQLRLAFWAGEIKNFGTEPVCDATIKVAFKQANVDAQPRHQTSAKLEGEQRVATGGGRVFCVLPGTIVPAYAAPEIADDLMGGKMDTAEVTWQIDGTSDAVVDPLMPSITVENVSGAGDEWAVAGKLVGSTAGAVKDLRYAAYLGFGDVLEFPDTVSQIEPLAAGEEWSFATGLIKGPAGVKPRLRRSISFAPSP
jgi:hypothetical protein